MKILLVACVVISVDQISKYVINAFFSAQSGSLPVIPDVFHISYVENTGIAFGMFRQYPAILMSVIVLSVLLLIVYIIRSHEEKVSVQLAYGFIIGGAVGNLIDRFRLGYVVDFLDFRIWPVFNFADTFISIGVGLILLDLLFHKEEKQ